MVIPKKIDLHMHTTVSDGTDTPEELLAHVRQAGLELFSVTDHDSIKACAVIRALLQPGDPAFLTGVEFSCRDEEGRYHILGYGFDPDTEPIRKIVKTGHGFRMKKVLARLEFLETRFRFAFPEAEKRRLLSLDNPGKPHLGNLMVKYGYAKTKEEAIKNFIDQLKLRSEYVRPEDAIAGILGSGGIPVLAHPCCGSGDEIILGEELDNRIRKLMDYGLQGLEAFYSGFSDKLREQVLSLAEKYDLYITAGSDYHGKNKLVRLGSTGLESADTLPDSLLRLLNTAHIIHTPIQ